MNSKVFLPFLLLFCIHLPINDCRSQNNALQCGFQPTANEIANYQAMLQQLQSSSSNSSAYTNLPQNASIPIHFWINKATLSSAPTAAEINNAVEKINTYFHFPNNAQFTLCGLSYIDDNRFYNMYYYSHFELRSQLFNAYHKNNVINVYIVESVDANFAMFPSGQFSPSVVMKDLSTDYDFRLLGHELGHTFNLYHTFNETYNGVETERERVIREFDPTKPHREPNWGSTADFMKETPADIRACLPPIIGTSDCNVPLCNILDDNGDRYTPDLTNLMSYYPCSDRFVPKQQEVMDMKLAGFLSFLVNASCAENTAGFGSLERVPVCVNGNDTKIIVKNANVKIINSINSPICTSVTDQYGYFRSCDLPKNTSININPVFNSNPKNGVTTFDIALISSHVLGVQPMTEPFTLLAADVDNSGEIDALDMLYIRRLVLNQISSFPNNVNSWRFVPQYFL